MKVRTDFVTNSSSSSYVIAYKKDFGFDEETLGKYPWLNKLGWMVEEVLSFSSSYGETEVGAIINNPDELDDYFKREYTWSKEPTVQDVLNGNSYLKNEYMDAKAALKNGFSVMFKRIDYSDESSVDTLHALEKGVPGFKILQRDD